MLHFSQIVQNYIHKSRSGITCTDRNSGSRKYILHEYLLLSFPTTRFVCFAVKLLYHEYESLEKLGFEFLKHGLVKMSLLVDSKISIKCFPSTLLRKWDIYSSSLFFLRVLSLIRKRLLSISKILTYRDSIENPFPNKCKIYAQVRLHFLSYSPHNFWKSACDTCLRDTEGFVYSIPNIVASKPCRPIFSGCFGLWMLIATLRKTNVSWWIVWDAWVLTEV